MPYENPLLEQIEAESKRQERLSRLEIVDGTTLLQTHYEEPRYLWDEILPDAGLAVCAASKAAGKTLLLLQLADAIVKGLPFLGVDTVPSNVLFLELELSQRRTAQRLAKMGIVPTKNLQFAFKWQQGAPGLQDLTDFIAENRIKLVVVDVMQLLWPMDRDNNSYQDSYTFLAPLRQTANQLGCMILLVTHRRKMEGADYIDSVIGSTGIVANADVVLSLARTRGEEEAVLAIDGNDIESSKIALRFDTNPLGFQKSDADPAMAGQSVERRNIVDFIRQHGGSANTHEIATALGMTDTNTSHRLKKLVDARLIVSTGYGKYSILTPCQSDQSSQSQSCGKQQTLTTLTTLTGFPPAEVAEPIKRTGSSLTDWPAVAPRQEEAGQGLNLF